MRTPYTFDYTKGADFCNDFSWGTIFIIQQTGKIADKLPFKFKSNRNYTGIGQTTEEDKMSKLTRT